MHGRNIETFGLDWLVQEGSSVVSAERSTGDWARALCSTKSETDPAAKPLKGFGGSSVMEIVAPFDGNTWRTVYTVKLRGVVYVLHAFQKKSKTGIATPKAEIDRILQRLAAAEQYHRERAG